MSAGSAMACMIFSDSVEQGLAYFLERTTRNERNVYPENVWGEESVFPHERIYRETILHVCDEDAVDKLRAGPDIRVLVSRPPDWLGSYGGVLAGFLAYEAEKLFMPGVHPEFARRVGFTSEVISLRTCDGPEDVADLILQSSCTPPFTPVYERAGRPVLDGGLVDNVPVSALSEEAGRALVLLTRRYDEELLPSHPDRVYVQPSGDMPVDKWDYANPDGARGAFDLGRRDGEAFLARA